MQHRAPVTAAEWMKSGAGTDGGLEFLVFSGAAPSADPETFRWRIRTIKFQNPWSGFWNSMDLHDWVERRFCSTGGLDEWETVRLCVGREGATVH